MSLRLPPSSDRRVVVITGARQTGKTTLVRSRYADLRYVNCDDGTDRDRLRNLAAAGWAKTVGAAVIDEAQKEPTVFEKVKYAYDDGSIDFTVLLGSSRFLLMDRVRETLAGRAFLYELWPLLFSEILATGAAPPPMPLLDRVLAAKGSIDAVMDNEPTVLLGAENAARADALDHLQSWGGMPELLRLSDDQRHEWLRSYQLTFLERDLADLVRIADLNPFRTLQTVCMERSGGLLSYSEVARDAGTGFATRSQTTSNQQLAAS